MIKVINSILQSILNIFYQSFWFAVLIAFLSMFFFFSVKENGLKGAFNKWRDAFKSSKQFRRVVFFAFFTAIILIQTLFNRGDFQNPLANILGDWVFYYDKDGRYSTRPLENAVMLLPFTLLLFMAFEDKVLKKRSFFEIVKKSTAISFCFSLSIEILQLIGCVGTFQISDIAYNTLGGLIGGIIYYIGCKISNKRKKD